MDFLLVVIFPPVRMILLRPEGYEMSRNLTTLLVYFGRKRVVHHGWKSVVYLRRKQVVYYSPKDDTGRRIL